MLFVAGGVLALASLAVPHWPVEDEAAAALVAAAALPMGGLMYLFGRRFRPWMVHVVLVAAAVQIAVGTQFLGTGGAVISGGGLYVWLAIFAFYFLSWRAAAAHMAFVGLTYAVALAALDDPAGPAIWLVAMGTAAVAGVTVGALARQLRALAATDGLTGLPNRWSWEESLQRELARARRLRRPLCIATIDLDQFKALNDAHGHTAGDLHLRELAAAWTGTIRANDVLARYGGDEFALLLPDADRAQAVAVVERMRAIAPGGFSTGLAEWDGTEDAASLLERADIAVYRAKESGRGHTVVAGDGGHR